MRYNKDTKGKGINNKMKIKLIHIDKEQEKKFEELSIGTIFTYSYIDNKCWTTDRRIKKTAFIKIEEIDNGEKCINAINLSNGKQVHFEDDSSHFIPLESSFSFKGFSITGNIYVTPYELK